MKMISENLGRIIAALAAIAVLVCCVTGFRAPVSGFFDSILDKEQAIGESVLGKLDSLDFAMNGEGGSGGSGGAGNGSGGSEAEPELGFPLVWNSLEVVGNTSFVFQEMPFVLISEFIPSATELADTEMSAMGEKIPCIATQEMGGFSLAVYGSEVYVFSVYAAGEYTDLGISFPETGLYVMDFGAMGVAADFVISKSCEHKTTQIMDIAPTCEDDGMTDGEVCLDCGAILGNGNIVPAFGHTWGEDDMCSTCSATKQYINFTVQASNCYMFGVDINAVEDLVIPATFEYNGKWYKTTAIYSASKSTNGAFYNYTNIKSVTIPNTVTSIGDYAFYQCTSIVNITIPESVTNIGRNAFQKCSSLTSIAIPYGITTINTCTFSHCTALTSITIPDTVTTIGNLAFAYCTITSVGPIGSGAVLEIPNSVTTIGDHAFNWCTNLTSFVIPDGVTHISEYAFHSCTNLKVITIPSSVTSIGDWAFLGCENLKDVRYVGSETDWAKITFGGNAYSYPSCYGATIHYNWAE